MAGGARHRRRRRWLGEHGHHALFPFPVTTSRRDASLPPTTPLPPLNPHPAAAHPSVGPCSANALDCRRRATDVLCPGLGLHRALFQSAATTKIEDAPPSPPPFLSLLCAVSQMEQNQASLDFLQVELLQLRGRLGVGEGSSSRCLQGGEPQPGREARWCTGIGVPRHPHGPSVAVSEIEEAPPSTPPVSRLLVLNTVRGPDGLAVVTSRPTALALMVSHLQKQGRECGEGGSRCSEGEDVGAVAGMQMLEHELGMMHKSLNSWRDRIRWWLFVSRKRNYARLGRNFGSRSTTRFARQASVEMQMLELTLQVN